MNKKNYLLIFIFPFFPVAAYSQNPIIVWQNTPGGSSAESAGFSCLTSDGGYAIVGSSSSADGDVTFNNGLYDIWVAKLNVYGGLTWQHSYGGSQEESCQSIRQTADGGFILAGATYSNDGDITINHGGQDFWILKIDSSGAMEWQKSYGGSDNDWALDVAIATDGGYVIAGQTESNDGDVSGNHGSQDFWIIKLNVDGSLSWQKCFGGSAYDIAQSVKNTSDGGYIIAGRTASNNGDVSGNHSVAFNPDVWLLKIDSAGNLQWQKCRGGSYSDQGFDAKQTTDGGYVVAGKTSSNDQDVTGYHGQGDYWIFKTDSVGEIVWQKCLGGTDADWGLAVIQTMDGGYVATGNAKSVDNDVVGNHGQDDMWMVALDGNGQLKWQYCLGGTATDVAISINQLPDKKFILSGTTSSPNGDVLNNHGSTDYWIMELKEADFVRGICFIDYNQNGIKDPSDVLYNKLMVVSSGNGFISSTQPDSSGRYYNFCDTGIIQTTLTNVPYYTFNPDTGYTQFTSFNHEDTIDFALTPIPGITDVSIAGVPKGAARVNGYVTYRVIVSNNGTDTTNGKIFFVFNPALLLSTVSIPYDSVILDTISWTYQNLDPFGTLNIDIKFFVPLNPFFLGDTLSFTMWAQPDSLDENPADNTATIFQVITGAVDPNNKFTTEAPLLPFDFVINGKYLTYIITFQNTGTDTAFSV